MATKRKRFAVIETSLMREPWPHRVKLASVMLTLHMTDRWAAEKLTSAQAVRCVLTAGDALNVTGAQSLEAARQVLRDLAGVVTILVTERDEWTEIFWPKLATTQGWNKVDKCIDAAASRWNRSGQGARNPSRSTPVTYPSASASAPASAIQNKDIPAAAAAATQTPPKPKRERAGKTPAPERLTDDQRAAFGAWLRAKHPALEAHALDLEDACLDHHRAKGNLHADWVATCRTWARNQAEGRYGPPRASPVAAARFESPAERVARSRVEESAKALRLLGG